MILEQLQPSQLQVVEVQRGLTPLLFVELPLNHRDDLDQLGGISSRAQIEKGLRDAPCELILPDQFIKLFDEIANSACRSWPGHVAKRKNRLGEIRRWCGFCYRKEEFTKSGPAPLNLPAFFLRPNRKIAS